MLGVLAALLLAGEGVLALVHWQLYQLMVVVDPATGLTSGNVAAPLWIESEKLYVWALIVAVMGLADAAPARRAALSGVLLATGVLAIGGTLAGQPFTDPLPGLVGQYVGVPAGDEPGRAGRRWAPSRAWSPLGSSTTTRGSCGSTRRCCSSATARS